MLRLFDRYILKEVLPPFLIGLLIYTFVLLMNQILILTEQLVTRGVSVGSTALLLFFLLPAILAFTVPMAVLMGILAGLSRLSSDSEVVAFKTLGVSNARLLRPLLLFALGGWVLASFLTLYLAPRSNYRYVQTYIRSVLDKVQLRITPRVFNESIPNTVIFIQDLGPQGDWKNVMMYLANDPQEPRLILARSGRLRFSAEGKKAYVELQDGADHSYPLGAAAKYRITFFKGLKEEMPIENLFPVISAEKNVREKDIGELIRQRRALERDLRQLRVRPPAEALPGTRPKRSSVSASQDALAEQKLRELTATLIEVHKKFALPFACLIFVFLGLPLGASTRKGGRTSGFTISIVIIILYYILITAGEELARDRKISAFLGMWGPNLIFILASVVLFIRSNKESPRLAFFGWLARRRGLTATAAGKRMRPAVRRPRPQVALPFPNILDRYIMRKFTALFLLVFFGLLVLTAVVTFFERLNVVYEHNKPTRLLTLFIWHSLPEFTSYILPVAALTAMLLALGFLTKFNEITAMKACGISLYRIIVPVAALAFAASLLSLYLQERILPGSNTRAEQVWDTILDNPSRSYNAMNRSWMVNRAKDRFYHFRYFDAAQSAFSQMTVYDIDRSGWTLRRRLFAERAVLREHTLVMEQAWVRDFSAEAPVQFTTLDRLEVPLAEGKEFFMKEWKEPSQMNFGELRAYIREVRELGFDTTKYRVDLHYKVSFPLVCLIMTLLGVPFAFAMGKRGTLVGIGLSFVIAMLYWGAIGFFRGLGYAGSLNVVLAAWAPNLVFGLAGLYGLLTLRT